VAHGAEGFEDFGDVGGFGAGESFGRGFGGDGFFGGGHILYHYPHGIAIAQFLPVKSQFIVTPAMSHFQAHRCQMWLYLLGAKAGSNGPVVQPSQG
jgi:hypothetical protein